MYTPLQRRWFVPAVFASGCLAIVVDSVLFLHLAGIPAGAAAVAGLILGKFWVQVAAVPVTWELRHTARHGGDRMITLRMTVIKQCPFRDETDTGELIITLPGDAPELHNLAEQVGKLCAEPVTHEDFTRSVRDLLNGEATIVTRWHTGPWDVEVTTDAVLREPHHRHP